MGNVSPIEEVKTMFIKRHEIMQEAAPVQAAPEAVRPEQDKATCGLVP